MFQKDQLPYKTENLNDFIRDNNFLNNGSAFIIIAATPTIQDGAVDTVRIDVAASAMSTELMRAMILASTYHHNIQDDMIDVIIARRMAE